MSTFSWLDSMSVGVEEFDADHRNFVETLGKIGAALDAGRTAEARLLCETLLNQTRNHCAREEVFLRKIRFPTIDHVLAVQAQSIANLRTLADSIANTPGQAAATIRGMQVVLVEYLLHADINYKSFVEAAKDYKKPGTDAG